MLGTSCRLGEDSADRETNALAGGNRDLIASANRFYFTWGDVAQVPGAKTHQANFVPLSYVLANHLGEGINHLAGLFQVHTSFCGDLMDQLVFTDNDMVFGSAFHCVSLLLLCSWCRALFSLCSLRQRAHMLGVSSPRYER